MARDPASNVALYSWTLPVGADPVTEFGNSHRIIWIQRLPAASRLQTIGGQGNYRVPRRGKVAIDARLETRTMLFGTGQRWEGSWVDTL